jgi:hypothetical protein
LEKAPEQEREEEIKKRKHKEELKKLEVPKAGEKVNEQKKGGFQPKSSSVSSLFIS